MSAPRLRAESRAYFRALGKHVSQLRKDIGMTQAELARALKVSQQTVLAYELGSRCVSVPTMQAFLEELYAIDARVDAG